MESLEQLKRPAAAAAPPEPWPHARVKKILVVGPAWVGDMVIAQSAFRTLKGSWPQSHLTVLAPRYTSALLHRMPEVDAAVELAFQHGQFAPRERWEFGRRLRTSGYDWCIVLQNSFKSALIPYAADIPVRSGYIGEWRWGLLNDIRYRQDCSGTRLVDRFNYLVQRPGTRKVPAPNPCLTSNPGAAADAVARLGLHGNGPVLALCPGAEYGAAKRWPPDYFAEVAAQKIAQGWRVWVFGTATDIKQANTICAQAGPQCINLAGRTSLLEAVDLLSLAKIVVTNDSGLMHIASSLGCRVISIFGSTDPANTPPLGNEAGVLSVDLPCRPCFARTCRFGHYRCLFNVSSGEVLRRIG